MKILYISNGSNFLAAGGMEYHLIDITRSLEEKGIETALAVRKGTFIHQNLLTGRKNIYPLSWTGLGKLAAFFQIIHAIRSFSPDIVSINRERDIVRMFFAVKLAGLFMKKRPRIVSVFHNVGWKKRPFVLARLDGIIYPNKYLQDNYVQEQTTRIPTQIIHHGIHLPNIEFKDKLDPFRKRKYFRDTPFPIIGMVGELRKNQTELIDVAYQLKQRLPDFTFAIVGRGNDGEVSALWEKIRRLGLEKNFILTGNVNRASISDVFYDLDISITTNRHEPFGLVFLESLASMTPLVAYDSGGPVEIVSKGGGVLVSGGPKEMADELYSLITNHDTRMKMGLEGRRAAEQHFSIEAMSRKHFEFYSNLIGRV